MTFGRLWLAPPWMHVGALALVLVPLAALVGSPGFAPDEGAAILQARSLSRGDGWIVAHPLPEADPTGRLYPVKLSEEGTKGFAPLAKHPLYPMLLAGADRVGGVAAMVLLSVAGTVAAAGLAGALAARLAPGLVRPAIWVVGLASPLMFDGFLVMGHTLAAAAAAGTVLAAVSSIERRSWRLALAVAPCLALAALLRSEALLFGSALAAAAVAVAVHRRQLAGLAVAAAAVGGGLVAYAGERLWVASIVGGAPTAANVPLRHGGNGFVGGRLDGLVTTWLTPSQANGRVVVAALLMMTASLAAAGLRARWHPTQAAGIAVPAGAAAVAAVVALVASPANIVPGLLVAFPLLTVGLVMLDRRLLAHGAAAFVAGTFGLFAAAVVATQYATGGTGEWGGRYFALGLPAAVPVALLALHQAVSTVGPRVRQVAGGALAVCTVSVGAMAVLGHRAANRDSAHMTATVAAAVDMAGGNRPVVVSTDEVLPRLAWPVFDRARWLVVAPEDVERTVAGFPSLGVRRFVLVTAPGGVVAARVVGAAEVNA